MFLYLNILTQRKLFVFFRKRCLKNMKNMKNNMKNKHILLVWEEVSTPRRYICKKLQNFWGYSFFLQVLYKWIRLSFRLRYHCRKQILLNVAARHRWINIFRKNIVAVRDWWKILRLEFLYLTSQWRMLRMHVIVKIIVNDIWALKL